MKAFLATTCIATGAMLTGGCATKKYVRNTTAPVQAKVDQVGEQANRNAAATEEARKEIKAVEAMNKATEAGATATNALSKAEQNASEISAFRNEVRNIVANIDDYKPV